MIPPPWLAPWRNFPFSASRCCSGKTLKVRYTCTSFQRPSVPLTPTTAAVTSFAAVFCGCSLIESYLRWHNRPSCFLLQFSLAPSRTYSRRRQWHPTLVLLPGKSHGWRSLVGCSPWGREESDMTEQLHFHFSLSCTGEGNGNPLQCSCLENPRDGGAWWAAVYGVTQSQTRLKWLSSSSSSSSRTYSKF